MECPIRAAADEDPGQPAIRDAERTLTYAEVDAQIDAIGRRLTSLGLKRGDRLAVRAHPRVETVLLLLALWRHGIVACPVNMRHPVPLQETYLGQITPRGVVAGYDAQWPGGASWPLEETVQGAGASGRASGAEISLDRTATIVATSGSTGPPRAAVLSYGALWYSALGSNENIELNPTHGWLLNLPLYHVSGLGIVMRCIVARACVIIPEPGLSLQLAVERFGPTHVSAVPTQLRRLMEDGLVVRPSLRAVLLGGAPVSDRLAEDALKRGIPLHTSYGLTEMCSQVTTTPPGATLETLRTAGMRLPHREISLSGDGEILVRGRTLFSGYAEGNGIRLPLDDSGWFRTGDLGHLDHEGRLHVRGRRDNMFISGGENIHPEVIEAALLEIEDVFDAIVVPIDDAEYGRRPVAFVSPHAGAPEPDDLEERLRAQLPGYMIPIAFHAWPEFAMTGMKPSRAALAAEAGRLHGLQRRISDAESGLAL